MKKRKICVVTGSRAEYGLLKSTMSLIQTSKILELQIIVTGMHLVEKFGNTVNEIRNDKFIIDEEIDLLLLNDNPKSISKSIGLGVILFSEALDRLKPDIILILGDRFEIFPCAIASMAQKIPIAHIHGGEVTPHMIDEAIRHSISKMAHLHFVATKVYERRVIQMGENPDMVFNVGGLGVDNIKNMSLLNKENIESELKIKFWKKNLLVTFHPLSLEKNSSIQMIELIKALSKLNHTLIIFTMPNADSGGSKVYDLITKFVSKNENAISFTSLGVLRYLSLIKYVDGVIGNSSSGLLEVPSLKKGTINIGDRQKNREKASSVINCAQNQNQFQMQ